MNIKVLATAQQCSEVDFTGKTAVVIDVLRASSVIITALMNGARAVVPVTSVDKAVELYKASGQTALLGGEQNAIIIEGFHLGNSPLHYTKEKVKDREIILKTTNGTLAIKESSQAARLLVAGFLNLDAVADVLLRKGGDIIIVCSGTAGNFSMDDGLCAGMLIERLASHTQTNCDDLGLTLRQFAAGQGSIREKLNHCMHLNYLLSLGYADDISYCLQANSSTLVPTYISGKLLAMEA